MKPTEFLNELSNKKLGDYKTAAGADATAADKAGDYKRGDKRMSGIIKATKKEFANDKKKKDVAEATGNVKFDKMLKGITSKKEVAKQQKTDTKQQARDAFGNMFGGGNPADKLGIRKKGVSEAGMPFRGVGGAFNRGDDERHDLDPTEWYIVKDGKMYKTSVYPNQVQQAIAQGYSRTRDEAKAKADKQGVAEGKSSMEYVNFSKYNFKRWEDYAKKEGYEIREAGNLPGSYAAFDEDGECVGYFYNEFDLPNGERYVGKLLVDTSAEGVAEEQLDELSCWSGYHRVAGTKAGFPGSCAKNKTNESEHSETCPHCGGEMVSEELMNEKKDACYYKVKSRYKVWPSAYASGALVKCRKSGADSWGNGGKKNEGVAEGYDDEDDEDDEAPYHTRILDQKTKKVIAVDGPYEFEDQAVDRAEAYRAWAKTKGMNIVAQVYQPAYGKDYVTWQVPEGDYDLKEQGVAEEVNPEVTSDDYTEPSQNVRMGDFVFNARTFTGALGEPNAKGLQIRAYEPKNLKSSIGSADFIVKKDKKGNQWLESDDTEVNDEYRGKGVATMMYAFAKSLGNDIKDSPYKSKAGSDMWKKWGSDAKHLVGEQGVEEHLDEKWTKKYKDSINCSNPKGFSQKAHCAGKQKNESSILEGINRVEESLHDWFNKEKWVRMDTKGKIKGPCAREPGEGKPKCLPQAKAHSLGKKGRASAASRKRREDPNPERSGKAINVNTKKQSNENIDEDWKKKLGAAALAGSMALGAAGANARVTPDGQGGFTGGLKPSATVTAPSDSKPAAEAPKGFSKEYLQKAADPNRTGRYMISVEKAQELLKQGQ